MTIIYIYLARGIYVRCKTQTQAYRPIDTEWEVGKCALKKYDRYYGSVEQRTEQIFRVRQKLEKEILVGKIILTNLKNA
jgi:hypothetical protein